MSKFFGLTIDGLLPSKAKAEVEGIATAKAEGAVSDVRATAELASEKVRDLAGRVTTLETTGGDKQWPTGDVTDYIRGELAALNGQPGVVRIPEGKHYIGGGSTPSGVAFTLATGQRLEGVGHNRETNGATVLYVDDQTQQSSHLVRSENTSGVAVVGLTFENRATGAIDVGRDPVYLRECSDFELSYNTTTPNNVGFQFDINIKANPGTPAAQWGRKGWVHDSKFTALTEFHSTHDMLVENCEWNIDRSQVRPNWLKGATQTAWKFSGNWAAMTGAKMRDCTISVTGVGEKFEAFEIVRAPGVVIERLVFNGTRPETPSNIQMSTPKLAEMGLIEGQMDVSFRNCEFGNMPLFLSENVALSVKNSRWKNTGTGPGNFLWDGYNPANKQAAKVYPNEIHVEGCDFYGGGRILAATGGGGGLYTFTGCTFEYDNRVYNQGISVTGANKRLVLTGCRIRLVDVSNGAVTFAYLRDIGRSDLNDVVVTADPGVTSTTPPVWVGGSGVTNVSRPILLQGGSKLVTKESKYTGVVTEPEPTGPVYVAAPTNGKDGAMTNAKAIMFTANSLSSPYHREAAHLSGSGPHPLVIHLHGDGYEEYTQYNSGTANSTASKYAKVAVDNKALFILPRTPDTGNQTWWSETSSTTWLVALIRDIKAKYNIDERRIFISGYSGGAEEVTYNLACDYHTLFKGGGAMLLGGGGAEGLTGFTGTPAADIKSDFLMRWWYGETDNGVLPSDTTIDAISASAEGEAWYKTRGFNTGRTMIPGVNHYTSETYGPDLLRQLIDESNTKYGV